MTTSPTGVQTLPGFLQSSDAFATHIYDLFDDDSNTAKGDAFVNFAVRLTPFWSEVWGDFPEAELSEKKTHDGGVDFISKHEDKSEWICGQSKYRIKEKADIDDIISKFESYEKKMAPDGQQKLGLGIQKSQPAKVKRKGRGKSSASQVVGDPPILTYVVVTSSDITNLIELYERSSLSSKAFYDKLKLDGRIHFLYGEKVLRILQVMYRQNYVMAPTIELRLAQPYIKCDDIYLSLISGDVLAELHDKYGSALFFENIREFLGVPETKKNENDEEAVNHEILRTLREEPQKMASRNNGITIKADRVVPISDSKVSIEGCSIVNGCQTTMCTVMAPKDKIPEAKVVVKIVEGGDPWDIAKSANYQNRVSKIDLELAQFLRPQLVRKSATDLGFGLPPAEDEQTVSNLLESIHREKVSYDAVRMLYLGIFSRYPNNMFSANYSEVRVDILRCFGTRNEEEDLLRTLFQLLTQIRNAIEYTEHVVGGEEAIAANFRRFFNEKKPQYQCLVGILAACACAGDSLANKPAGAEDGYERLREFVSKVDAIIEGSPKTFHRIFQQSFVVITSAISSDMGSGTEREMKQQMYRACKSIAGEKFKNLYDQVQMQERLRQKQSMDDS